MPRKYKRKPGVVPRIIGWTEDNLALAFEELRKKKKSFNEVSRVYGIPSRTLRRRYEKSNQQLLTQGKYPVLGFENEKNLVADILKLGYAGFPPDGILIRQLAYQLAEKLGLKHNFNHERKMAGPQWLKSFLERNSEIAQGLSIERARGLKRTDVANSGVSALEKISQDSEQSLASNERNQVSSLIKQEPGVCTLPESESNQNELLSSGHQVPSNADNLEIIVPKSEQNNVNQNHTPPRPSSSLSNLSQDYLALEDCDIKNYILDNNTALPLPSLISSNESKLFHQASPIPRIPLSITKRSKQSAEILNSKETKKNKPAGDKKSIEKKKGLPQKNKKTKKYIDILSSETESDETDIMKQDKIKALRKRRLQIYSSDSSSSSGSEENTFDSKRGAQKRLKIKNVYSIDLVNMAKNVSINNYCVECFENYNLTITKSDWIQYEVCRMWLNETCTKFKNYCIRCGKLKALASGQN